MASIAACNSGSEYSPVAYSRNASRTSSARSGSRTTLAMSFPAILSRTFKYPMGARVGHPPILAFWSMPFRISLDRLAE